MTHKHFLFMVIFACLAVAAQAQETILPSREVAPVARPAPTIAAPASAGEMAQRQALLEQYLTPQRYDALYQSVIEQYASMAPNNVNAQSLQQDPAFRDQIFKTVQTRASKSFTLDELKAMQRFIDSPEGVSISNKVNALGLQFRQKELDESERVALRTFSQSPEGKSIAAKGVTFASGTLGDVMRAVLVRQAMGGL